MRKLSLGLLLITLIVLISACDVTVTVTPSEPFPNEEKEAISANSSFDDDPVVEGLRLTSGETIVYKVSVSSSVASNSDVIYFDAGTPSGDGVEVTAYSVSSSNKTTALYGSTDQDWFGLADDPDLNLSSVSAQAVEAQKACSGPCLVVPAPSGKGDAYFRVTAKRNTELTLYVFGTTYSDENEPQNDGRANATIVTRDVDNVLSDQGAIETIDDVDWFESGENVATVKFSASNDALGLRADVYNTAGTKLTTLSDGARYDLPLSEPLQVLQVRVYSQESRAAASADAIYSVEFE